MKVFIFAMLYLGMLWCGFNLGRVYERTCNVQPVTVLQVTESPEYTGPIIEIPNVTLEKRFYISKRK